MTQLKLYNTLTREKDIFKPLDIDAAGNVQSVRMYVCGITPYDFAHIGNLRTMVVFDVLYRLLKHVYPNKVEYVRNYTDIDDKIVQRAAESGKEPFALADEFIQIFERDMGRMGILEPTATPRVSQHMVGIVSMVNTLLEKGSAYITESGDVMFDVPAFEALGKPHDLFGHIARRTFDNLQARVEEDAEKRDSRDFPVWKANSKSATKMEQAFNPKELGATFAGFEALGRPGWHIECSVMSEATLGQKYQQGHSALFDIHGGGEDLAFPHHSCEIAQTEAFHPECTMSSVWMHAAFLTVEGQKMSKSLNNFVLVEDALKKYSPEAIRLWLLQTHYRKPVDYSEEALEASENAVKRIKSAFEKLYQYENVVEVEHLDDELRYFDAISCLENDLSTSRVLAYAYGYLDEMERAIANYISSNDTFHILKAIKCSIRIRANLELLGLESLTLITNINVNTEKLLEQRSAARTAKNWAESDRLRDVLKNDHGILVEDGPTGQTWRRA